jgi:azurin
VLVNPDAMPHNVVIGRPGAVEAIGTAAASMAPSPDPAVKPYVPALPSVLFSTRLVQQGESERLVFTAPTEPGAYVFLCTFPGHWLRMYGVMLVVPDIGAWEASPTVPIDPMTKQPFTSRTNP